MSRKPKRVFFSGSDKLDLERPMHRGALEGEGADRGGSGELAEKGQNKRKP